MKNKHVRQMLAGLSKYSSRDAVIQSLRSGAVGVGKNATICKLRISDATSPVKWVMTLRYLGRDATGFLIFVDTESGKLKFAFELDDACSRVEG